MANANKEEKEVKVLLSFIEAYCNGKHLEVAKVSFGYDEKKTLLCEECKSLSEYAIQRRLKCPKKPKPLCKKCQTKCYSKKYKATIKEVMRFSGKYFMKRGRIDYIWHYFF